MQNNDARSYFLEAVNTFTSSQSSQMVCTFFGDVFKTRSLGLCFLLLFINTIRGVSRYVSLPFMKLHTLHKSSPTCLFFRTCMHQEQRVLISRLVDGTTCRMEDTVSSSMTLLSASSNHADSCATVSGSSKKKKKKNTNITYTTCFYRF